MYYKIYHRIIRIFSSFALTIYSFSAFSDVSECTVTQMSDGTWQIVCNVEGSDPGLEQITVTNTVFFGCESLKYDFLSSINEVQSQVDGISTGLADISYTLEFIQSDIGVVTSSYPEVSFDNFINGIESLSSNVQYLNDSILSANSSLSDARNLLNDINCSDCTSTNTNYPGSGGVNATCPCPVEFDRILGKLNEAQQTRQKIYTFLSVITNSIYSIHSALNEISTSVSNSEISLSVLTNLVESTNGYLAPIKDYVSTLSVLTNLHNVSPSWTTLFGSSLRSYAKLLTSDRSGNLVPRDYTLTHSSTYLNIDSVKTFSSYLRAFYAENLVTVSELASLNNYEYNKLTKIQLAEKVFGRKPVLSAYNSSTSGDYGFGDTPYAFLTNYYLTLANGGSLSGDLAERTNWFDRVEALLAALVFSDTKVTNLTVSSVHEAENFSQQFTQSLTQIASDGQTRVQTFKQQTTSIIDVFNLFTDNFHDASMPQSIRMFTIIDPLHENEEITFQDSDFTTFCDLLRGVTTFIWASTGLFLLYKFLVWIIYKYWALCVIIFRVASQMFKTS